MDLVVDIGNQRIHFGVFDDGRIVRTDAIGVRAADKIADFWKGFSLKLSITDIAISSVNPGANEKIKRFLRKHTGISPRQVGVDIALPMSVLCDEPEAVGTDRVMATYAAFTRLGCACIVVDYGTAITFDVASPSGDFLGGVIAPGVGLSRDALHEHTALLPHVDVSRPERVLGKNTTTAMQSGLYWGFVGLVDYILERLRGELGFETVVVATGGYAEILAPQSRFITQIIPTLVLEGVFMTLQRARGTKKYPVPDNVRDKFSDQ